MQACHSHSRSCTSEGFQAGGVSRLHLLHQVGSERELLAFASIPQGKASRRCQVPSRKPPPYSRSQNRIQRRTIHPLSVFHLSGVYQYRDSLRVFKPGLHWPLLGSYRGPELGRQARLVGSRSVSAHVPQKSTAATQKRRQVLGLVAPRQPSRSVTCHPPERGFLVLKLEAQSLQYQEKLRLACFCPDTLQQTKSPKRMAEL